MKKIMNRLNKWWLFTFKNPTITKFEVGGYKVKFKRFYLEISSISDNFHLKVRAGEHPYGYLFAGVQQGNFENTHGFCDAIYTLSNLITRDQGLVNDISSAIRKYHKRLEKKAKEAVKNSDNNDVEDMAELAVVKNIYKKVEENGSKRKK